MSKVWLKHGLRCVTLLALGFVLTASTARGGPVPGARRRAFKLFSGFLGRMNVNRWDCGLAADGHVCVDPNGSTTVGGGFWPGGTPDQYVFGSGIQIAGVVDPASGFTWAGDTTAAFFEDPSGSHENGEQLSLIWQASNAADLAGWPRDAYVPNDPSLYAPVLIGTKSASQGDVWARYWDGNPGKNAGRPHPLGVLVDQRGMAWNFPSGNEDITYWIFTVTNITASKASVYAGRPDADSLAILGARFKAANDPAFAVSIPDTGYTITSAYFAFAMDADVEASDAKSNFTTAFLPFNMGIAFKSNWFASTFVYPSTIFSPPFAPTSGEVGVKYLRSPYKNPANPALGEIGLVLYSATVNAGAFGDAANAAQLYRYLSGTLNAGLGDAPCTYAHKAPGQLPKDYHVCYIASSPDDVRFFQSSGPFTLAPGQSQTIAVAYIGAAPVDNPAIKNRGPGFVYPTGGPDAEQPESLAAGIHHLTALDSIFGALSFADTAPADGKISQNEITVVPRSLLGKGNVAQAVFDAKFLLPFPPDAPEFFLIPGDNQVTVVWKPSATEQVGDPYFAVASFFDPLNPALYDPNYRKYDVEGYRIYRGRTSTDLELIAQFDRSGTSFIDYTGEIAHPNCAPELGVQSGCPKTFGTAYPYTVADTVPIVSPFVQVPAGGRVKLASGDILIIQTDTASTGATTATRCAVLKTCKPLTDTGVPFAFVDHDVKNGFTYFYTVAAFDVNSVKSTGVGSASLEGKAPAQNHSVVPRKNSAQVVQGQLTLALVGGDGSVLNPDAALPSLGATGIFSGPMPPTNGIALGFPAFIPAVVKGDSIRVIIDSVVPGDVFGGTPATYYVRALGPFPPAAYAIPLPGDQFSATNSASQLLPSIKFDQALAGTFGGDTTYALLPQLTLQSVGNYRVTSYGRASINSDPENSDFNGPRWWAGAANENTADPNGLVCSPAAAACVQADLSRNAGGIAGVGIFHPSSYSTVNSQPMRQLEGITAGVFRAADFKVYWGATAGTVDSVVDVTHHTKVPFKSKIRASWGFLNDSSFTGLAAASTPDQNNGVLTWTDIMCVDPAPAFYGSFPGCTVSAPLMNHAKLEDVVFKSATFGNAAVLGGTTPTGKGFIFYLNGHFFLMQLGTLPSSTVWNARFYAGNITGTVGSYKFAPANVRPPAVPGLTVRASFTSTTFNAALTSDSALAKIHTVPDPYYVTNAFEQTTSSKVLRFVNLPSQCIIRIYSLSGILVQMLAVNDVTGGGEGQWDLRNRNNQFVASGVYFYHVETPDGKKKIGRFTIVNFAQ